MTAQQPIASADHAAVPRPQNNPVFQPRIAYIDNLRWTMIVLVISMHAADTYSPLGSWYYTDRQPLSVASLLTLAAWQMYLQSFFMGLLFFIAGCFVPASYDRRGPLQFLRERATRLGLPVLFYMFMLGPVTEYFCSHSWTSTRATSFATEWVKHIRNGEFLQENGPLWFCLALLILGIRWLAIVLPVGSVVWLIVLSTGGATAGNGDAYAGGWHWQAASMNVWESFTCVAMCYGLLAVFRAKFNTQGLIARFLSDNAFSVYVFHPPIVVMGARLLHGVLWPALIKVVILTCLSSTASFVLSAAVFRRIPLLRRVL
jgi:fucose 4-O-acetylase-like acetyltransferase